MAKSECNISDVKTGFKFRGLDRDLWHVVGTLPDGDSTVVVVKSWAKYKRRWCYEVYSPYTFQWILKHQKELEETKKKK